MVYRVYVEKKPGLAHEAQSLKNDLKHLLGIERLTNVRLLNRYDVENIEADLFEHLKTTVFGEPQLEVDCHSQLKSAAVPRVSPDGRYLLFTRGDYGQFHIWHHTADLWLKDLETGEVRSLDEVNSRDVDSYHSWSSNGRWMVFASRRLDGSYSRPFIAYFDVNGKARKPFLLPQEDPENSILLMKSYNVPEFAQTPAPFSTAEYMEVVAKHDAEKAKFGSPTTKQVDGKSGASNIHHK